MFEFENFYSENWIIGRWLSLSELWEITNRKFGHVFLHRPLAKPVQIRIFIFGCHGTINKSCWSLILHQLEDDSGSSWKNQSNLFVLKLFSKFIYSNKSCIFPTASEGLTSTSCVYEYEWISQSGADTLGLMFSGLFPLVPTELWLLSFFMSGRWPPWVSTASLFRSLFIFTVYNIYVCRDIVHTYAYIQCALLVLIAPRAPLVEYTILKYLTTAHLENKCAKFIIFFSLSPFFRKFNSWNSFYSLK